MKMSDYPCLYRMADASNPVQCDFFCALSSIFELTPEDILTHAELFSHTSRGVLFHGDGISLDDIETYGKKRLEKPFADCKSLSTAFSSYALKTEACQICKLSTTYSNQFLHEERLLIAYILKKFPGYESVLHELSEKKFYSVCYLSQGKSLRTYPLVQFNYVLLSYLKSLQSFDSLKRDELQAGFSMYLHEHLRNAQKKRKIIDITDPEPIIISLGDVTECVNRELNFIYNFSEEELSRDALMETLALHRSVKKNTYKPPQIRKAKNKESDALPQEVLSGINNKKERTEDRDAGSSGIQLNMLDLIIGIPETQPAPSPVPSFIDLEIEASAQKKKSRGKKNKVKMAVPESAAAESTDIHSAEYDDGLQMSDVSAPLLSDQNPAGGTEIEETSENNLLSSSFAEQQGQAVVPAEAADSCILDDERAVLSEQFMPVIEPTGGEDVTSNNELSVVVSNETNSNEFSDADIECSLSVEEPEVFSDITTELPSVNTLAQTEEAVTEDAEDRSDEPSPNPALEDIYSLVDEESYSAGEECELVTGSENEKPSIEVPAEVHLQSTDTASAETISDDVATSVLCDNEYCSLCMGCRSYSIACISDEAICKNDDDNSLHNVTNPNNKSAGVPSYGAKSDIEPDINNNTILNNNSTKSNTNNTNLSLNWRVFDSVVDNGQDSSLPSLSCDLSEGKGCGILYPNYQMQQDFVASWYRCATDGVPVIHSFLTESCSSTLICIEAVRYKHLDGLLFYLPISSKYYYFDLKDENSSLLQAAILSSGKVRYLTLNSVPVYDMLSKFGFRNIYLEMLPNLFCAIYEKHLTHNLPYAVIFNWILGVKKKDADDFYQFAMPLYQRFYDAMSLLSKSRENPVEIMERYKALNHFNYALSSAYDMSNIVLDLNRGVTGTNMFDYELAYSADSQIISPGTMYIVKFNFPKEPKQEEKELLFHSIISKIYSLPYTSISYAKLISISPNLVAFFCTYDGDKFFDIFLDCSRNVHRELFEYIPMLETYRLVFE